ncbi:MAG TPA: hypothetical protein VJ747_09850 [Stellaceae bacterium]|nr:hypothetical protein [Stellaceae bacterium]
MTYATAPLACDPRAIKGLSEKLLLSHYENNYGGAVKRLNAITTELAALDVAAAPVFILNGLKREELIAANSMILHEVYFASLGAESAPDATMRDALSRDFGSPERWRAEFVAIGQGAQRRLRLGAAHLVWPRRQAGEPMGGGSYAGAGRRRADPRARHV